MRAAFEIPEEEPSRTRWILPAAIVGSLISHALFLQGLGHMADRKAPAERIEFEVVKPEPPPPPAPEPEPPKPQVFRKPELVQKPIEKPPPPLPASNRSTPVDDPPKDPPKPVFGLTEESTVADGAEFEAPVGNTLMKDPETRPTDPALVKPYYQPEKAPFVPANIVEVTSFPTVRNQVSPDYPPDLREAGVEGTVIVEADISDSGDVVDVRIKRGMGNAFDGSALDAIRRTKYNPAKAGSTPVAVRVAIPVKFRLR